MKPVRRALEALLLHALTFRREERRDDPGDLYLTVANQIDDLAWRALPARYRQRYFGL